MVRVGLVVEAEAGGLLREFLVLRRAEERLPATLSEAVEAPGEGRALFVGRHGLAPELLGQGVKHECLRVGEEGQVLLLGCGRAQ